jgi:hypothetical protein
VAPKAAAAKAPVKASKTTAKASGLHLTTAQWAAYNKAYNAVSTRAYNKAAIQAAALNLRKYRLAAAAGALKKAAAARVKAAHAKAALQSARTGLARARSLQNAALTAKADALVTKALKAEESLQAKATASAHYAQDAVRRELSPAQALAAETALFAKAAKVAKAATATPVAAASKTSKPTAASSKAAAQIAAAASAAGLAAARKVPASAKAPAGRTAPRPEKTLAAESWQESPWCGAWRGDPDGYDCVAAAVANHLLHARRLYYSMTRYWVLREELGQWPGGPSIAQALAYVSDSFQFLDWPSLASYGIADEAAPGTVIGFATARGPHAALYLGEGLIASWGEVLRLQDVMLPGTDVEEAWTLTWAVG